MGKKRYLIEQVEEEDDCKLKEASPEPKAEPVETPAAEAPEKPKVLSEEVQEGDNVSEILKQILAKLNDFDARIAGLEKTKEEVPLTEEVKAEEPVVPEEVKKPMEEAVEEDEKKAVEPMVEKINRRRTIIDSQRTESVFEGINSFKEAISNYAKGVRE